MGQVEVAVWRVPGKPPTRGVVIARPTGRGKVTVRWDDGREEKVSQSDPVVRFAPEDSRQLRWLLDPDSFDHQFRSDPLSIFVDVLRDAGSPLSGLRIRKAIINSGVSEVSAKSAWADAKAALQSHDHVSAKGDSYCWSDKIVDPYAELRGLTPEGALQRLLKGGLKQPQKDVLAEVIRAAFR